MDATTAGCRVLGCCSRSVVAVSPPALPDDGLHPVVAAFRKWALAAAAASLAETATFPLDVTKTRLQLQNELGRSLVPGAKPKGMIGTGVGVLRHEGPRALYRGLSAAVIRQAVYGGIGLGFYQPVRNFVTGGKPDEASFYQRVIAGCATGGFGQLVASPTDVVKVRLQADGRLKLLGQEPRYKGAFDAFRRIGAEEGAAGYFRGLMPSVQRAAVINGTGIAVYDHAKRVARDVTGQDEGLLSHVVGSLISGLASALVSTPFDVLKTRLMNQRQGGDKLYRGMLDCLVKTVRSEGVLALYKGFLPAYARLGPWQLVFFVSYEQIGMLFNKGKSLL